jgi:diamine N-acetyltransferase
VTRAHAPKPPRVEPGSVSLREITADTVIAVVKLQVGEGQDGFVATNAVSLAQALFSPEAWYRAVYLDETLVGFVMVYDESLRPEPPPRPAVGLWRFMIDGRYQGRGVGAEALRLVIGHVRSKARFETLEVSYVPGDGSPERFYLNAGFRHTGRVEDGEVVLELPLTGERQ